MTVEAEMTWWFCVTNVLDEYNIALTPLAPMVIIDSRLYNWTVTRALSDNYLRKEGAGLPYYPQSPSGWERDKHPDGR
jgi:hypothetical protein